MALPRYHTCASLPTCRIYVHPFRNSFGLIELCRLSQDTRLTSDSCSSGWSFVIGFLHQGRCLPRLARLTRPSSVRADSGLSPHRHTCVAGRSYKMPALLSDSGHSVFAYAKSYRGPSLGRYEPEQVTPSTFCCHPSAVTTGSRETNPSGLGPAAALGVEISGGILFKDRAVRIRYFAVIAHAAHFR